VFSNDRIVRNGTTLHWRNVVVFVSAFATVQGGVPRPGPERRSKSEGDGA